ncbi:hypothetical protein [Roseiconus lacunae]|uniref:hypothetical protein n=1 Tax=Roseiconus lacunae TaxID=2605694 RepID=UPI0011F0C86C|nr:hypothetical protein [Roseiconus lacunae]
MKEAFTSSWNRFWFAPSPARSLSFVRVGLGIVTALYFLSALPDVAVWFASGAPASTTNLAEFFRTAELTRDARWMVSPLFIWDALFNGSNLSESTTIYRAYLLIGAALSIVLALADRIAPRCPRILRWFVLRGGLAALVWIWFVGWANRVVLLAGVVEPVLSVSLAALMISPIAAQDRQDHQYSWRTTLSRRLIACQFTLIGILTTATMLASPTWWNGTGAYGLLAPTEDRFFDVRESWFETPLVYEGLTLVLVWLLPLGLLLAWKRPSRSFGVGLIWAWALLVGLMTTNVLYAATFGIIATSLGDRDTDHASA